MKPLRVTITGYDRVASMVTMREELMDLRERVTGSQFCPFPRIGGFDMSVWIWMHAVTGGYDG